MPNYQLFEIYKNEEKVKFVKNWKMDIFKNLEFELKKHQIINWVLINN
jgi:hypothetical protein